MRPRHLLVLLAAVGLLAVPVAAVAAGTAQITSPGTDQQLAGPVAIEAVVDGPSGGMLQRPPDHRVTVRLSDASGGGPAAGTSPVTLRCTAGACNEDATFGGERFDPVTFAPFGRPTTVCNGAWFLQVDVDGDGFATARRVLVSQLPAAPVDVTASGGVEQATVTWSANGERDLAGYRVQRRAAGTSAWTSVAEVDPTTTTLAQSVAAGSYEFRVLSLRPDGRGADGSPAPICTDTGRELSAASSARSVDVAAPAPAPAPTRPADGSGSGDGGGSTDGGSTGGGTTGGGSTGGGTSGGGSTGGGTTGGDSTGGGSAGDDGGGTGGGSTGDPTSGDDTTDPSPDDADTDGGGADGVGDDGTDATGGDDPADAAGGGTTPRPGGGPRVAPPRRFGQSSLSLGTGVVNVGDTETAPRVAAPSRDLAGGEEDVRYYGEDDPFSDEIDFGDTEAIGGFETRQRTVLDEQTVRIPGALQTFFGEELAVEKLLGSLAGGMLLLTLALHLRRWAREGAEV